MKPIVKYVSASLAIALTLGAIAIWPKQKITTSEVFAVVPKEKARPNAAATKVTSEVKPKEAELARQATRKPTVVSQIPEFVYRRELDEYSQLKKKAVLTEQEKTDRKRLLSDPQLMSSLATLARLPAALGSDASVQQNSAIDMLLEASAAGGSSGEAAASVLRSVVSDPQIEDEKADPQLRRSLAEVKAEVLYNWSSQEPRRAGEMEAALPGPVSRRLWQNVQDAQASNAAESMSELKKASP